MATIIKSVPVAKESYLLNVQSRGLLHTESAGKETAGPDVIAPVAPASPSQTQTSDSEALIAERVEGLLQERLRQLESAWAEAAEEARLEAVDRGYREGLLQAESEAADRHRELLESVQGLAARIQGSVAECLAETESLAGYVAWEAIVKIVGDLTVSGELITSIVRQMIKTLEEQGLVSIALHPDDVGFIKAGFASNMTSVRLIEDGSVARGGCIVETSRGILDARLETQLENLLAALRGKSVMYPETLVS